MRRLMWFTLGFGTSCGIFAGLQAEPAWIRGLVLVLLSLVCCYFGRKSQVLRRAAVLLLGAAAGLFWFLGYSRFYLEPVTVLEGKTEAFTVQASDYSYETDYGAAVDAIFYRDGKPYRGRFYLNHSQEVSPGDFLEGAFKVRITVPGGQKDATYHRGKGIFILGYQKSDVTLTRPGTVPRIFRPMVLRHRLIGLIDTFFPGDTAGFARALLLGDKTGLNYETVTEFKVSGISHVIAVSGLHVSILFGLIYTLCLKRKLPTAIFGISGLILFAAVAGFTPSVTRASIMLILMILAMAFNREYDGPTELSFACLVMLILNPMVITSVSFQLSVSCVAGIFLFYKRISLPLGQLLDTKRKGLSGKIRRWINGSISVTLSATVMTTPLVAFYFGTVSLVGILTNLLALWPISAIFYGIMLACAIGSFWSWGGMAFAWCVSWLIRYVCTVSRVLASFPLSAVYTRSWYIVAWLVFCYVLLAAGFRLGHKHTSALVGLGALGLCAALFLSWTEPMRDQCRMTVLDVGQGQSVLLQSGGKAYLVDCGGSYEQEAADLAAETLMAQGIFRLDGLILTHYDWDHAGGIPLLEKRMSIGTLFLPDTEDDGDIRDQLLSLETPRIMLVPEDLELAYDDTTIRIYGPALAGDGNDRGLAVLFQCGTCDILITGDRSSMGEALLLAKGNLPQLDVLVAGHHGSKYSTSEALLRATNPVMAAISSGKNNSYGHPAPETLERLEKFNCIVYRTDLDGNLIFRR